MNRSWIKRLPLKLSLEIFFIAPSPLHRMLYTSFRRRFFRIVFEQDKFFSRMNKINISTGRELYGDIEQISRHRLSPQALSNVKPMKFFCQKTDNSFNLVICFESIEVR